MDWTKVLKCPRCSSRGLTINVESNSELLPEQGEAVCPNCDARFPIRNHALDLAQRDDMRLLTLAGLSNYLPLLPWGYENIWRPRSLTLLSGETFSVAREIKQLNDWLAPQSGELLVDLGSSTDLYARGIGKQIADATIVAIDMASGMLEVGRKYALREDVKNIVHVRAPVQRLPFADASVDALACGGSLNEFRSMGEALREARRVVKPGGRMFTMSLLQAASFAGRLAQWNARLSGIRFPSLEEFNRVVTQAGWRCERQKVYGVVVFTLITPHFERVG